ncbi:MAG: 1,2-phenylacetyl-CoA epoxidase subunit PaaC [Salinirussus sp.]
MATAEDSESGDRDLAPGDLTERQRRAVETLLFRLADDELVHGERYTEWQVRAPTLESDLAISNNLQDELGHARLWYDAIQRLGYTEESLLWESDPGDFQHATLVELPFAEGDWADAVLRAYLYDAAEEIRLAALEDSTYEPIRDRASRIQGEEGYHLEHATSWLERLVLDDDARQRVQDALDRLYPYALTLFEPVSDVESDIDELGLRTRTLAEMREEWATRVEETLTDLGLTVPDAEPATPIGRDGEHTDHWDRLHEEMTSTYRELGRSEATRIMESEDE